MAQHGPHAPTAANARIGRLPEIAGRWAGATDAERVQLLAEAEADAHAENAARQNPDFDPKPWTVELPIVNTATISRAGIVPDEVHQRWRPTPEQMKAAEALLHVGIFDRVFVGLALPGKTKGVWTQGQLVEAAPGLWPLAQDDYVGYRFAREEADRAAGRQLAGRPGVSSYAVLHLTSDTEPPYFAVFEGVFGNPSDEQQQ